jgi:streptomycin 3"-adenylyltransferase
MTNLAVMIAQTLAGNRPLTGPPPDELLDAVPVHDLVRGSLAGIPDLINDLHGDSRNVVLTCLGSGPR